MAVVAVVVVVVPGERVAAVRTLFFHFVVLLDYVAAMQISLVHCWVMRRQCLSHYCTVG